VLELQDVVRRQLLAVGAFIPALTGAVAIGSAAAPWLLGADALIAAALGGFAAVLRQRRREYALDLILEGRERLPLAAVADERRRLLERSHRRMLAHTLELIRRAAQEQPPWLRSSALPYCARTLSVTASQLEEIERLLRGDAAGLRGIALTQRLLVDGSSPLHGQDAQRLSEELRRITMLLNA
jgi:hypothetical protein